MSNLTLAAIAILLAPITMQEYKRMMIHQENIKRKARKYNQTEFI